MRAEPITGITPSVLKWARESVNMTTSDVAARIKKTAAVIDSWESGHDAPTYAQLETLAYDVYKRPLALFFLPSPPVEPRSNAEFRSLPQTELGWLSRDTNLLIRKARAFQTALIELHAERNPSKVQIWRDVKITSLRDVANQASKIRSTLGVSVDIVSRCPDDDSALKLWRRAIERAGIHVFKESFKQREISGFCLWHNEFPVILVNNSTTKTRQIFSLIHELAHILFDRSGISRFDRSGIEELPSEDRKIERYCNELAGEVLVPMADFAVASRGIDPEQATDQQFATLAERYHVSRSVILRRFVERNEVPMDFYLLKDREWSEQRKEGRSGGNYYATQGTYLSERFLHDVVSRYSRRQLTKAEAAELIGVKTKHFDQFEDMVLRGSAA